MRKALFIPIALVALAALALVTANAYRVPTIEHSFVDERPENVATVEYVVSGLRCRGTAVGLARQIAELPGMVSITAYARTRTAIIEYDPTEVSPDAIRETFERPMVHEGEEYQVFSTVSERALD